MNNTFKLLGIATSIAVAITSCGSSGTDNQQASTPAADTARLAPVETKAPNSTYKPAFEGQTRIGGVKTTTPDEGKILSEGLNRQWGKIERVWCRESVAVRVELGGRRH